MVYRILLLTTLVFHVICNAQNQWGQIGSSIHGTTAGDRLGRSVSLNAEGDIMAIGSPSFTNGDGAVNVYKFTAGNWIQLGSTISEAVMYERFGFSVSLNDDGNILAVGARGSSSGNEGYVRVYMYTGTDWVLMGSTLEALQLSINADEFGYAVNLNSDGYTLAVGAPEYTTVYTYDGSDWSSLGLPITDITDGNFGTSVWLSDNGETLAIGFPSANAGHGMVQIYKYTNSNWVQYGSDITIDNIPELQDLGVSVCLSSDGTIMATTGITQSTFGNSYTTIRQVYEYNGSDWSEMGSDIIDTTFNNLGCNISLSSDGHTLAFTGANNLQGEPKIEVWSYDGIDWQPIGSEITGDIGGSISLNAQGNRVASGNLFANTFIGYVSVFDYSGNIGVTEEVSNSNIYPNPITSLLNIEVTNNAKYNLYPILGQEILQAGDLNLGENTLDLSYLDKGVYVLKIISEEGYLTTNKIIKQ